MSFIQLIPFIFSLFNDFICKTFKLNISCTTATILKGSIYDIILIFLILFKLFHKSFAFSEFPSWQLEKRNILFLEYRNELRTHATRVQKCFSIAYIAFFKGIICISLFILPLFFLQNTL